MISLFSYHSRFQTILKEEAGKKKKKHPNLPYWIWAAGNYNSRIYRETNKQFNFQPPETHIVSDHSVDFIHCAYSTVKLDVQRNT